VDEGTTGKGQPKSSNGPLKTVYSIQYTSMDINGIGRICQNLLQIDIIEIEYTLKLGKAIAERAHFCPVRQT
jgi:hypothetical protein